MKVINIRAKKKNKQYQFVKYSLNNLYQNIQNLQTRHKPQKTNQEKEKYHS